MLAALLPWATACRGSSGSPFDADVTGILESPDTFEILALDPMPHELSPSEGEIFHGYRVLGQIELSSAGERRQLLEAIYRGIHESEGMAAACFNPRHGIHAVRAQDTVDLVICFECLSMQVYGPSGRDSVLTHSSVEPSVSAIYRSNGLKIAPH